MPCDCGLLCLLTDRRRYCELLWRRRLLVTNDEKKAKRRFLNLMRGFDSEDLDVLRKAVESNGRDIKQCAPGPPMDLVEEPEEEEVEFMIDPMTAALRRDRVLFQRQKFPEAGTTTSPHSNAIAGAVLTTARQQPRKYSSGRPRRTSSINRRYNYATDENANTAADLNESTSSQGGDDYYYDQPTSRQLRQKQGQPPALGRPNFCWRTRRSQHPLCMMTQVLFLK
uniref:Uncharacterized protein n=1 Tax=Ditylenchus dipsaci TaxID=166011 RepID=A0A915EJ37_9BILA